MKAALDRVFPPTTIEGDEKFANTLLSATNGDPEAARVLIRDSYDTRVPASDSTVGDDQPTHSVHGFGYDTDVTGLTAVQEVTGHWYDPGTDTLGSLQRVGNSQDYTWVEDQAVTQAMKNDLASFDRGIAYLAIGRPILIAGSLAIPPIAGELAAGGTTGLAYYGWAGAAGAATGVTRQAIENQATGQQGGYLESAASSAISGPGGVLKITSNDTVNKYVTSTVISVGTNVVTQAATEGQVTLKGVVDAARESSRDTSIEVLGGVE